MTGEYYMAPALAPASTPAPPKTVPNNTPLQKVQNKQDDIT